MPQKFLFLRNLLADFAEILTQGAPHQKVYRSGVSSLQPKYFGRDDQKTAKWGSFLIIQILVWGIYRTICAKIVNKGFSSPNVSIRSILTPKKVVKLKTLGNPLFLGQTFFGGCARGRKIEKFPVVEFSHILCLTRGFWTL